MRLRLLAAITLYGVAAGFHCDSSPVETSGTTATLPFSTADGLEGDVFISNLELPTSLAFPPDGSNRLFVNELQTGRIWVIEDGVKGEQPFATLPTNTSGTFPVAGENGLLGIAFDPDYASNGFVYVTYVTRTGSTAIGKVARLRDEGGRGTEPTILLDGIPAAPGHQIQSLAFGPDRKLYVSVGDAYQDSLAQEWTSPLGKILRMNPDGSIPDDNPIAGSHTFASGLRNCFDLAFDNDGNLYAVDNGPAEKDELNQIEAGVNYGWPLELGHAETHRDPVHVWPAIVSPTGMLFPKNEFWTQNYPGSLFVVLFGFTYTTGVSSIAKRVQSVDLRLSPPVFEDLLWYDQAMRGNPVDIAEGPDGHLYISDIFQGRIYRIRRVPTGPTR